MNNLFLSLLFISGTIFSQQAYSSSNYEECFKKVSAFFAYQYPHNPNASLDINKVSSLDGLEKEFGGWNYYYLKNTLPLETLELNNKRLVSLLDNPEVPSSKAATKDLIDTIYQRMINSKQVLEEACYDRDNRGLGFCFGRALIIHLEGLKAGIDRKSIRKIWAVGNMKHEGFHVAAIIKGSDRWYVLDNRTGVIPATEWMAQMASNRNSGERLMFFTTQAERFSAHSPEAYTAEDLFGAGEMDFYNGFFRDYFANFIDRK